jgi:hypothetical protein
MYPNQLEQLRNAEELKKRLENKRKYGTKAYKQSIAGETSHMSGDRRKASVFGNDKRPKQHEPSLDETNSTFTCQENEFGTDNATDSKEKQIDESLVKLWNCDQSQESFDHLAACMSSNSSIANIEQIEHRSVSACSNEQPTGNALEFTDEKVILKQRLDELRNLNFIDNQFEINKGIVPKIESDTPENKIIEEVSTEIKHEIPTNSVEVDTEIEPKIKIETEDEIHGPEIETIREISQQSTYRWLSLFKHVVPTLKSLMQDPRVSTVILLASGFIAPYFPQLLWQLLEDNGIITVVTTPL